MSYQGTTSDNNEITEEDNISQAQRVPQAQPVNPPPPPSPLPRFSPHSPQELTLKETGAMTSLSTESGDNINHEDDVTLFVAYDGKWEYDNKEWFFENSKSSTIDIPKRITLSEITDILNKQFKVNKELYHLKLEVHYRTGSPWFPVTEIQNDKDLSVFISETSKTRLPLCVSRSLVWYAQADKVDEERRKDYATVFVEYNGKWYYDGKEWFFKNSKSSTIFVPKRITLSEITNILYEHLEVDKKLYRFDLKVQHGTEYPSQIKNNQDLSAFISKTSETKLSLFVTRIYDYQMSSDVAGEKRKAGNGGIWPDDGSSDGSDSISDACGAITGVVSGMVVGIVPNKITRLAGVPMLSLDESDETEITEMAITCTSKVH
nr:ankyrin repeat family protein [Tanacetum cinerariifolium]